MPLEYKYGYNRQNVKRNTCNDIIEYEDYLMNWWRDWYISEMEDDMENVDSHHYKEIAREYYERNLL